MWHDSRYPVIFCIEFLHTPMAPKAIIIIVQVFYQKVYM